jgi:hypothetical protein
MNKGVCRTGVMIATRKRREKEILEEKLVPQCHSSIINPTWIGLRSNARLLGERPPEPWRGL